MAQAHDARIGDKRAPGRASKTAATPATKKLKTTSTPTSTQSHHASSTHTPPPPAAAAFPVPITERRGDRLPWRVVDNRPLPTLAEPQSVSLPSDEYRGVAASAVLAAALERSRMKWTCHGVLQKYWTKPETGKAAKPPPPDNPELKWMKPKGECRIRLEPHVFTADVYVEERPKNQLLKQQQNHSGQQNRPQPAQSLPHHPGQNRPLQPGSHPGTPQPTPNQPNPPPRLASSSAALQQPQDKKASPDPVISLLASRASSNPELKRLMKEVATGLADSEQLRVFQEHIDELTEIIKKQKEDEKEQAANTVQSNGNGDAKPSPLAPPPAPQPTQQQMTPQSKLHNGPQQPSPLSYPPQQSTWTQAPITHTPLILAFKDPGSSEDRFLFPQMSVLEPLSPQHELVSFIAIRKGDEAASAVGLEPEQQYWQPVTMMVEVAYGREEILSCIRRWVKPLEEVRKYMEDVMQRFQRAPPTHLAFRLPYKGCAHTESEDPSKEATPVVEEKTKLRPTVKNVKKLATSDSSTPLSATSKKAGDVSSAATPKPSATPAVATPNPAPSESEVIGVSSNKDGAAESESRRRTLRKSVRIEGSSA